MGEQLERGSSGGKAPRSPPFLRVVLGDNDATYGKRHVTGDDFNIFQGEALGLPTVATSDARGPGIGMNSPPLIKDRVLVGIVSRTSSDQRSY